MPLGGAVYVHGVRCVAHAARGDHLLLVAHPRSLAAGCLDRYFAPGLLLRWLGYTWRAVVVDPDFIILEAWGATYLASDKLALYD